MQNHLKTLIIGIIIAVGVWAILWNPIEYLDQELGTLGLTALGIVILFIAWRVWKKRAF